MTQRRRDNHSTEFGLWLRNQKHKIVICATCGNTSIVPLLNKPLRDNDPIDSKFGYVTTNIDYVWRNYRTKQWLYIEEKRRRGKMTFPQSQIFNIIHSIAKNDKNYCGFFLIQFENMTPDDGRMWINDKEQTKEYLLQLLTFEPNAFKPPNCSYPDWKKCQ